MLIIDDASNLRIVCPLISISWNFGRERDLCGVWGICEKEIFHRGEEKRKGKERKNFGKISLEQIDSREEKKERGQECILGLEIRLERRKVTENYGLHGSFLLIASRNASSRRINWG